MKKFNKVLISAVMMAFVIALSGCNDSGEKKDPTPTENADIDIDANNETDVEKVDIDEIDDEIFYTETPERRPDLGDASIDLDAFTDFELPEASLKLQHPSSWMSLSSSNIEEIFASEDSKEMFEGMGMSEEVLNMMISNVSAFWYDFADASEYFVPNTNITITPDVGLTQENLADSAIAEMLEEQTLQQFAQMFSDFENDPAEVVKLGDNTFFILKFSYTIPNTEIVIDSYQATTAFEGNLYVFTFTTTADYIEASLPVYNSVLETIVFGD